MRSTRPLAIAGLIALSLTAAACGTRRNDADFLAALKIERVTIVGHRMNGQDDDMRPRDGDVVERWPIVPAGEVAAVAEVSKFGSVEKYRPAAVAAVRDRPEACAALTSRGLDFAFAAGHLTPLRGR